MKNILTLLLSLSAIVSALAQQYTIQGTVRDENGNPVSQAQVISSPSREKVTTASDGSFSINVSPRDKQLRVKIGGSVCGRKKISSSDSGQKIDIEIMRPQKTSDKEQTKGNTYYPTMDDNTIEKMIDGRFPGCFYSGGYIYIRGQMCLYYQVDGVPIPSLDLVNPYDIYSITIIKDMADCVIYGRQARNGAVIIQMKNGKNNAPKDKNVRVQLSTQF